MNNYNLIGKLEHVTKSYNDVVALSDISFSIERGQIIGFLGPNGSGKSTSIQLLLGLIKPQAGSVSIFGVNPFYNSKMNNLVGYIPEESQFPKWMTAFDYLFQLARFNMDDEPARERTTQVLKEVELLDVADKQVRKFSKGMRQRVKIAQALLHKPALIIGDEPFNGLDPVVRQHMFDLFRKYRKEYNCTIFLSSHILFEIEKLADKIILVYKGRTIAQGTPSRIREMIQDQPHTIEIVTKEPKKLARILIDSYDFDVVSSIQFNENTRDEGIILNIKTTRPKIFYDRFTNLVVDNKLPIVQMRPTDEGLESLFNTLTVG